MAINSEDDVPNMLHDNQLATGSSLNRTPLSEMNKRRVNFYAISCESCQELFRQNALRPPAKFEENLPIDQVHPLNIDDRLLMTESNWLRIHQVQYGYSQAITLNKVIGVPLYPATQSIHSTLELIRIPAYRASIRLMTFMKQIPEFDLSDTEDRATLAKHNLLVVVFMHVVLLCNPVADIYHEINTEEIFCSYDISHEPSLRNPLVLLDIQNRYLETLHKYCLRHYVLTKTIILFTGALSQIFSIQGLAVHLKDFVHNHIDAAQLSPLMKIVLQLTS
ncbi:unnamed protein product [Rotaria magnacalcarata]|uniref:NR LBD domain-containing protein n=1 Tax=Rotaria magnacalcarata TaxID=392030 RepID=A0A819QJ10_9BILA|nr:unnamed protein product [Rotaria magnacalcarata]CAF4029729.1 unnamed protein product [Rotaria magnacalcarata]